VSKFQKVFFWLTIGVIVSLMFSFFTFGAVRPSREVVTSRQSSTQASRQSSTQAETPTSVPEATEIPSPSSAATPEATGTPTPTFRFTPTPSVTTTQAQTPTPAGTPFPAVTTTATPTPSPTVIPTPTASVIISGEGEISFTLTGDSGYAALTATIKDGGIHGSSSKSMGILFIIWILIMIF
jgi:cytoskeletal protein RodZ